MKNGVVVRIIGVIFVILALGNLFGLLFQEVRELLISVPAVLVRYSLMLVYGIGLVLLRKWAVYLFVFAVALNWATFYAIYDGVSAIAPLWESLVGPLLLAGAFYASWKSLQ